MIKNKDYFIGLLFVLIVFQYIFIRYPGSVHSLFMYNIKYYSYNIFENNFYLQNSLSLKTSILYPILRFLNLNLENDFIGFSVHFIFSIFNGYLIFKIIKKHLQIKDFRNILLICLVLISCDNFFIEANRGSWIISHTNSPTYFAKTLILLSIYLLLEKRIIFSFISLTATLSMHIKVGWILIPIFFLFLMLEKKLRKQIFWLIIPLILMYFLSSKESLNETFEIKKFMFDIAVERDGIEGSFKFQPLYKNIALFFSFVLFYYLNKKENSLKNFNNIILLIASYLYFFNIFYVQFISKFYPDPRVIIMGIPRALEIYETFFWLLVLKNIINSKYENEFKILSITFLFFFLIFTFKSILFSVFIIIFSILIYFLFKNDNYKKLNLLLKDNIYIYCFLIIFVASSFSFYKNIKNNFNLHSFKNIKKWTIQYLIRENSDRFDTALSLKKCDDFLLEDIDVSRKATNYVSNKSNFFGNVHYNYLNYSFLNEHFKREKIKLELYNNIKERKKISSELIDNLKNYKLTILSKKHNSQLLEYKNKIIFSNGDVLTVFDDKIFEKIKLCQNITS